MALARLILLALAIALAPVAAVAAPNGIYVAVENGGLEYLILTSGRQKRRYGLPPELSIPPALAGGLQRSRRDLTGTANGGRIVLRAFPGWAGGQALTGSIRWSSITLQFTLSDGSIGQVTFKKMSIADANALIVRTTAAAGNGARINSLQVDLRTSIVSLRDAQAELPRVRQQIALTTQQLADARAVEGRAEQAEAAARAHESDEAAIEEQMRDQEAAMPDNNNADNEARNYFHGRVNDQHRKVNDAHGQVNNAHGVVISAASSVRMYERALANAQAREATLEQIIASSTTRLRQDSQILAKARAGQP